VQEAVVKALVTQAPAASAFAGMHEFESANGFGLGEHMAFGAIAEGATADEATGGLRHQGGERQHTTQRSYTCRNNSEMFNMAQCSNGNSFTHNGTGTNDGICGRHGDCCGVSVKMGGCDDTRWRRDMCMRSENFGDHLRRGLQPTAAYSVTLSWDWSSRSCYGNLLSQALQKKTLYPAVMGTSKELAWGRAQRLATCEVGMGRGMWICLRRQVTDSGEGSAGNAWQGLSWTAFKNALTCGSVV